MPVYLVTDKHNDSRVMVEAARPQGALNALIDSRFDVSPALESADALALMLKGVIYLPGADATEEALLNDTPPDFSEVDEPAPERPSLDSFTAAADADEADEAGEIESVMSGWNIEPDSSDEIEQDDPDAVPEAAA